MLAYDLNTGEQIWRQTLPRSFYLMGWGDAHSPIVVYQDMLIFNRDDDLAPFLVASWDLFGI